MFGLSDADVTAWATVALAFVGIVGIATGTAVTVATWRAAIAAQKATELQAREITVLETQTKLLQTQQDEARTSAFPWLQGTINKVGERFIEGMVGYVSGSAPAWSVEVWVRTSRGYYQTDLGFIAPGARREFQAVIYTEEDGPPCPFKEFKKLLGDEVGWVGVTWRGPGYWVGRHSWRLLQGGSRYVGEQMSSWFDEDEALDDYARQEREQSQERKAVEALVPPKGHGPGRLRRLLGRMQHTKP